MAPDLNSISRSPHNGLNPQNSQSTIPPSSSHSASRRTSTQMLPPPLPRTDSSLPSSPRAAQATMADNTGVGVGPGPIRHPRPLTAAELHLELEKEQESIVNRLTRELSALRAQTASVASTASSTSDHFFSSSDPYTTTGTSTTIIPTTTRRHRSSSNLSTRSARSIRDNLANTANTSVSGVAAPRDQSSRPSMELTRPDMSRQNSMSANAAGMGLGFRSSSSMTGSPHMTQTSSSVGGYVGAGYPHRSSVSSNAATAVGDGAGFPRSPSANAAAAAMRYEEAAMQRAELEAVKRENEILRARVKELEKSLSKSNEATSEMTPASGAAPSVS
ncbi:hypothetical protein LTR67_006823 [Exophiala xenobiotica]|nr:hypothetical protein LTR41_009928 [Exophiala xenobiotica]KAK5226348.1 hypothetical protein LTR47_009238 [Exophiala xenobiotica]KAK5250371.1 hypothetical protein LTS06_004802 [Exophiala xenobiotica]KAK5283454.1 hypothetical protein LTR40_001711 [Exophiala xenobiotica]KAK5351306.1 hypothetical protein LTR61_004655 [Exophiala xenobiotica]